MMRKWPDRLSQWLLRLISFGRWRMAQPTRNAFRARRLTHPLVGQPAPPIALATPAGETVRLAEFAGRRVLVTFWSSF